VLGQRIAQSAAAAARLVPQPLPARAEARCVLAADFSWAASEEDSAVASPLAHSIGGRVASGHGSTSAAATGLYLVPPAAFEGAGPPGGARGADPPTFDVPFDAAPLTYPLRAPKSRASAALLNRLLDDTLGRLRLTASRPAFRQEGPTAVRGARRQDALLQPPAAGRGGQEAGGAVDTSGQAAFDRALGGLLDQAYAKATCLVDYIHTYGGTDDADAFGEVGRSGSGVGGGGGSPPAEATAAAAAAAGPPLTTREQLLQCRAALTRAEAALAETTEAARAVLRDSKHKRKALAEEGLRLRAQAAAAAAALASERADRAREAAAAAAHQQAIQDAADAADAAAAEAARARADAGVAPPLTLEESAAEIKRLEAALAVRHRRRHKCFAALPNAFFKKNMLHAHVCTLRPMFSPCTATCFLSFYCLASRRKLLRPVSLALFSPLNIQNL
jgi:hypothetical protein